MTLRLPSFYLSGHSPLLSRQIEELNGCQEEKEETQEEQEAESEKQRARRKVESAAAAAEEDYKEEERSRFSVQGIRSSDTDRAGF